MTISPAQAQLARRSAIRRIITPRIAISVISSTSDPAWGRSPASIADASEGASATTITRCMPNTSSGNPTCVIESGMVVRWYIFTTPAEAITAHPSNVRQW